MRSTTFLVLAALGLIALGGFLITSYGKARYNEGMSNGKTACEKSYDKAKEKERKQHEKRKKKNYALDGDDLRDAYCEWVLGNYPRDKCLREVKFFPEISPDQG